MEPPLGNRLELACRLVKSVVSLARLNDAVNEGIHRLEELARADHGLNRGAVPRGGPMTVLYYPDCASTAAKL